MSILKSLAPYATTILFLAAWYSLVILGKTPTEPFVNVLAGAGGAVGSHGIHMAINAVNNARAATTPSQGGTDTTGAGHA